MPLAYNHKTKQGGINDKRFNIRVAVLVEYQNILLTQNKDNYYWLIGGRTHFGEDFSAGLTEQEATELFHQDIQSKINDVKNNIEVPLDQHQFDALLLLTYNIGAGALRDSTIRQYINNPDYSSSKYPTTESAWKAFNKDNGMIVRGLINHRNKEWDLYQNGI